MYFKLYKARLITKNSIKSWMVTVDMITFTLHEKENKPIY